MKEKLKCFIERYYRSYISGIDLSVFYVAFILIIFTVVFQNRALLIGYIFSVFLIVNIRNNSQNKPKGLMRLALCLIVFAIVIALIFKTDSTDGRLLIYKISSKMLSGGFPNGIGVNNFGITYGNAQIDYFRFGHYSQKELLLADNVIHLYNDYLELIIELGWAGVILILAFYVVIFFAINNALKLNADGPALLLLACIQIIAISIASLFTFMIYQVHWQFVLLLSLIIIIYYNRYFQLITILITGIILIGSLITYHFGHYIANKDEYEKANDAYFLYKAGYSEDANKIYKEVYPYLEQDNRITVSYFHSLMNDQKFVEAESLMSNLLLRDNSSINYDLLASCYEQQHKNELAEEAYLKSIYKVPNRFTGKFHLFLFYKNTNQFVKARSIGMDILKMPVKVPSKLIDYFKYTVKNELYKNGKFTYP